MIGIHISYDRHTQFWVEFRYNSCFVEKINEKTQAMATDFTKQVCNLSPLPNDSFILYNYENKCYESSFDPAKHQIIRGFCGLCGVQTIWICNQISNIANLIHEPIRFEYKKQVITFDNLKSLIGNFRR